MRAPTPDLLLTKVEPSADTTNVGDSSLLLDNEDDADDPDDAPDSPLKDGRSLPSTLSNRLEVLSICDDANSAEATTIRRALIQAQQKLLLALYDPQAPLTRGRLLDILNRQREALLSARDCVTARAGCLVLNDLPAKKKIAKKVKPGRRPPRLTSTRPATGTGLACLLVAPVEVDFEGDLYLANDYFSERGESVSPMGELADDTRSYRWDGRTEEELYGMGRLEDDTFASNIYFTSPECQRFSSDFD